MNTSDNLDLVVKHLAGGTNPIEEAQLQAWLRESEANQKQFQQLEKLWQADCEAVGTLYVNAHKTYGNRVFLYTQSGEYIKWAGGGGPSASLP